jgi:hypothetical protein
MIAAIWSNRDKDVRNWLAEFSVDFEKVFEVVQTLLNLYKLVKSYDENKHPEALLKRLPRPVIQSSNTPQSQQLHLKIEQKPHF